ncbi:Ty1/Copia family ribonuclease HI, partial [Klebsiella pneumoniae]|uniref:Ty1/Copia family ribonuclease HI n=1 Tax=Klebsiella pneumoniae TaxID=573 RepID=UPI001C5FB100
MMNGAAVIWKSKKQTITAESTAEAEYVAASACARDVIWFRNILEEVQLPIRRPTPLFVDNFAATRMARKDQVNTKTRSI